MTHVRIIVFIALDIGGKLRDVDLAAEIAAQSGSLVDGGFKGRGSRDVDKKRREGKRVDLSFFTARTKISGFEHGVFDSHPVGPFID